MGIIALTELIMALKGLIILPIITKLLGAEAYGIWVQITVTIALVTLIAILALPYTLVRFLAAEKNKEEIQDGIYSVLTIILVITLLFALFFFFFSGFISNFIGGDRILIKILAFIIIFNCLNVVLLNTFRAFLEMGKYSLFMAFQTIGELGLITLATFLGYGLLGAVLALLIIKIITFLMLFWSMAKKVGIKTPRFLRTKEYLKFGLPALASSIACWIIQSNDRYLISYFLQVLSVGIYSTGYAVAISFPFALDLIFGFVLPPTLSKFYDEGNIDEVKIYLRYSLKYFLALCIPFVFGGLMLSKQILKIFSTPEIASQGYLVVPIVALGALFFGATDIIGQILILVKKTNIIAMLWIITAFISFSLNILFIPRFGILGAAIAALLSYSAAMIITIYYSFKELKMHIEWFFILKSLLSSLIMSLIIWKIAPAGTIATILAIITGVIIYLISLILLKGFSLTEIKFFTGFLKNFKEQT